MQSFPKDQPEGTFANPITIEDDDDEEISVLQRSEEAREELILQFATYHIWQVGLEPFFILLHTCFIEHFIMCFTLVSPSVLHVVSLPSHIHQSVSFNDILDSYFT
jgi:hypothetical protein